MFSPQAPFCSFLSSHYLINLSLVSSPILTLLIILSTTLFHLQSASTSVPHPTTLADSFSVPNLEPLRTREIGHVEHMHSNQNEMAFIQRLLVNSYSVSYPFGLAPTGIVYQRFDVNNQDCVPLFNPTGDTNPVASTSRQYGKIRQVVRGMSFSLYCQPNEAAIFITLPPSSSFGASTLTINFTFADYDEPFAVNAPQMMTYLIDSGRGKDFAHQTNLTGWVTSDCVTSPEALVNSGATSPAAIVDLPCRPYQMTHESDPFVLASVSFPQTQEELREEDIGIMGVMICTHHAWESDYEGVDNGTDIRDLTPTEGSPRTEIPFDMETWVLLSVHLPKIEEAMCSNLNWGWF